MGKRLFLVDPSSLPDNLRCRRSDGRQWRCPQPAKPGLSFCEHHYHQVRRNQESTKNANNPRFKQTNEQNTKVTEPRPMRRQRGRRQRQKAEASAKEPAMRTQRMQGEGDMETAEPAGTRDLPIPDSLRCQRSDGRKWRCYQPVMPGLRFCEHHMRRNQGKRQNSKLASTAKHKRGQPARKLRQARVRGRLLGDGGTRTKQKIGDKYEDAYLEVTRDLPNGVMAISPWTAMGLANASPSVDWKLGSDYGFLLGRPFRSKNAERVPLATVQVVSQELCLSILLCQRH
ncbi:Growth-regulating factor 10 [Platanthera zijinensis]|uniref:Growth-regulating factor 10 n=1 Tax=Platanthera zijinensis TaxID=2320716 RepID=A0AAP0BZP8_9ASPA